MVPKRKQSEGSIKDLRVLIVPVAAAVTTKHHENVVVISSVPLVALEVGIY